MLRRKLVNVPIRYRIVGRPGKLEIVAGMAGSAVAELEDPIVEDEPGEEPAPFMR
jgi:hypothetical protein